MSNSKKRATVVELQPPPEPEPIRMFGPPYNIIVTMCWFSMTCVFILGAWASLFLFHFSPFDAGNPIALGGVCTIPFLLLNVSLARRVQGRHTLALGTLLGRTGPMLALIVTLSARAISCGSFTCLFLITLGFDLTSTVTFSLLSKQSPGAWSTCTSLALQYSNYPTRDEFAVQSEEVQGSKRGCPITSGCKMSL